MTPVPPPVKNDKTGNSSYAQVRYAITRDFVNFTEPQMWQDTGYSRIDSTVRKIGGYYYRFTKNEQGGAAGDYITTGKSIFLERSKGADCTDHRGISGSGPEHRLAAARAGVAAVRRTRDHQAQQG